MRKKICFFKSAVGKRFWNDTLRRSKKALFKTRGTKITVRKIMFFLSSLSLNTNPGDLAHIGSRSETHAKTINFFSSCTISRPGAQEDTRWLTCWSRTRRSTAGELAARQTAMRQISRYCRGPGLDFRPGHVSRGTSSLGWRMEMTLVKFLHSTIFYSYLVTVLWYLLLMAWCQIQ